MTATTLRCWPRRTLPATALLLVAVALAHAAGAQLVWQKLVTVQPPERAVAVAPLQDHSFIVGCRSDNTFRRYAGNGQLLEEFTIEPIETPGYVISPRENRALAATPDEKYLLSANYRAHTVAIIDLAAHQEVAAPYCDGSPYRLSGVTDQGAFVVHDRGVSWLDLQSRELVPVTMAGRQEAPEDLVGLPDGRKIALMPPAGGGEVSLLLTDANDQTQHEVPLKLTGRYDGGALALSQDGDRVYVLLAAQQLLAFDTGSGQLVAARRLPPAPTIQFMNLSPDGTVLALWAPAKGTVGAPPRTEGLPPLRVSGLVTLVDAQSLDAVPFDPGDLDGPSGVCFSPDSSYLYVPDGSIGVTVFAGRRR